MSEKMSGGDRAMMALMGSAFTGMGWRGVTDPPWPWAWPLALFLLIGGLAALAVAVLPDRSGEPTAVSPADDVAAARADAAAQIDAVRAEIAERDAQRRREMDERIAQMRAATQKAPPSDGWE